MDQTRLIEDVLGDKSIPEFPQAGSYLSIEEAYRIVDESIDYVGRYGDAATYKYLRGHRRRLSISLAMVPFAEGSEAACLDVGCFGFMAFWAWRYLGYARVEGIELRRDKEEPILKRLVQVGDDRLELKVHNFDIATVNWPIQGRFDTVLFLETLEHINHDPMGVMLNVMRQMHEQSILVMSVPNSVSYATLQRFVSGMPPWTYWFFNPDLMHEPRHCFEYTPLVFKTLLRAAGLEEIAFRTICAYEDRETLDDIFAIGEALSIDPKLFGETLIAVAKKRLRAETIRYPDCIYDSDRYYKSMFPSIEAIQRGAVKKFIERYGNKRNDSTIDSLKVEVAELKSRLMESESGSDKLRAQLSRALFICEGFLTKKERENSQRIDALEETNKKVLEVVDATNKKVLEAVDARLSWLGDSRLQEDLRIAIAWQRKMLRPVHWIWLRLIPPRRMIARWRGRI